MIGKLLSLPFKVVNAPLKAVENLMVDEEVEDEDRFVSKPLDSIAKELEKIDD